MGLLHLAVEFLQAMFTADLHAMQVFEFIVQGKYGIGQLLDLPLCFPDGRFPEIFIECNDFIMPGLNSGTKAFNHYILRHDFVLQFLQVFCTTDLLSFYQSHTAAGQGVFSFYVLTMLFNDHESVAVL